MFVCRIQVPQCSCLGLTLLDSFFTAPVLEAFSTPDSVASRAVVYVFCSLPGLLIVDFSVPIRFVPILIWFIIPNLALLSLWFYAA
jgi:hypothetical protein